MARQKAYLQAVRRILGASICIGLCTAAIAQSNATNDEMTTTARDSRISGTGIWKSVVPPVKMKGGFQDHDPIGLVAGKLIPADCSINWIDPDTHKLYCFTSATSLVFFLDSPQEYLSKAEKNWRALKGEGRRYSDQSTGAKATRRLPNLPDKNWKDFAY